MGVLAGVLTTVVFAVVGELVHRSLPSDEVIIYSDTDAINALKNSIDKLNSNLETIVGVQSET